VAHSRHDLMVAKPPLGHGESIEKNASRSTS
jgi:hypothetical protein